MTFLALEGLHVFVTGAAGGIGSAIVQEFLDQGCKVTGHDQRPISPTLFSSSTNTTNLFTVTGDISSESDISSSIKLATRHFGPINILCANAGITDESRYAPIWEMETETWDRTYNVNVRGTFLTLKWVLKCVGEWQKEKGEELENLAVVVTGSETGVFGQAGHTEYASGKAALQYGLVKSVKNEIVKLNSKARINAVAPAWVDTPLIEGRLDDPEEMYREAQATVSLRKIAKPADVARAAAFLASHKAAGHITGQCISVDGGMEGRIVWSEDEIQKSEGITTTLKEVAQSATTSISHGLAPPSRKRPTIKVAVSVDFDAVSGWLGTGAHPDNNLSDYSAGYFSGYVGVPRLLKIFKKLGISDKVSWFVPMHSAETFPEQFQTIIDSGCEIGLHGYAHEGAYQLTPAQEREVLEHCISVYTKLTGKRPRGYRAPLYQLRETTIALLEEHKFLYDTSLAHHDSQPYYLPRVPAIQPLDFSGSAKDWMHPLPKPEAPNSSTLVEIPGNWYTEDSTPLQFWPHTHNSHGYVDVRVVERMWMDRFEFLRSEIEDGEQEMLIYPFILHPDAGGQAHVIGMIERVLSWLKGRGEEVEFVTFESIAETWKVAHAV